MSGGAFAPNMGPPAGAAGPPPTLSAESMGPRLELDVKPTADRKGYTTNYAFYIEGM